MAGRTPCTPRADHIIDGLVFSFRAMGTVLPIAGFFFLGATETSGRHLACPPARRRPGRLLFEVIRAVAAPIPHSPGDRRLRGADRRHDTGLDGSGFAGLPLTGALSGALGPVAQMDPTTLAAIGQMGAIWTGGGTLIAWSSLTRRRRLLPRLRAGAVRLLFLPVIAGLLVSTCVAVLIF